VINNLESVEALDRVQITVSSYNYPASCSGGSLIQNSAGRSFISPLRFGFHTTSVIDSLLDKEDVQLEAILDEDDLLQECKAQNTRLIDYFQRIDILQRLFAYVTGQIESEEKGRLK
jgi:hypothetical protein